MEGGSSGDALDQVVTQVQDGLTGYVDPILAACGGVVVACLAFWGLRALVKWARTYFGK